MDISKREKLIKKIDYEIHVLSKLKETLQSDEATISQQEVEEHFRKRWEKLKKRK